MEQRTQHILEFEAVTSYLATLTLSPLGRSQVETLTISDEQDRIEAWLEEVSEVKEIRALQGHLPLGGISDFRDALSRARVENTMLAPLELRQMYNTLRAGRAVRKFFDDIDPPDYPRIREKVERIPLLDPVESAIRGAIDAEGDILDGASPALKHIRKELGQTREKIQTWLQNFLQRQSQQSVIQDQVITLRQNRYVIPVKASSRGKVKGIVHDQSSSGVTVFIEPLDTVEMNNKVASLEAEEQQEIQRILLALTDLVREHQDGLTDNLTLLAELDCLNAKARLSERWNCTQPKLREDTGFRLIHARHPLLLIQYEDDPNQVVPIDVRLDDEYSTLLMTGPNTGGKTVSLKTVGILQLMLQAGLHIPVDNDSEISIFTNIYADIGDQQSIEQSLSTFSSHISHIVEILRDVDERSLVLLDELGAGTDPAEGASLGVAILEYLDQRNATCIATTHHDALKMYAYTHPRTLNASVEFDVNTLSPTYRLLIGLPGKSNAFIIAERLGLDREIIQRAHELVGEDRLQVDHLIHKLTTDSEDVEKKKTEIDAKYRGVLRLEKETDKLLAEAEQEREDIITKALEEARQIVDNATRQSQDVLRKLPASSREEARQQVKTLHQETASIQKKLKKAKKPAENHPVKPAGTMTVGGKVRLAGLNQTGTVLSLSKDGKQAEIQVGSMRIEMPVTQLTPLAGGHKSLQSPHVSVSDHAVASDRSIPQELVIVGKRVDEALDDVGKYLDEAFLSGLQSIAIVHGMGTGKLKKAVSNLLRSHPHVVHYALDEQNSGMTNVTLAKR